jgi:nucleoid-associated protein YgaU
MIDRSIRISVAASVILGGAGLALLFRNAGSTPATILPESADLLLHDPAQSATKEFANGPPGRFNPARSTLPQFGAPSGGVSPTVVMPVRPEEPPPELPRAFPHGNPSNWGLPMMMMGPSAANPPQPVFHKIADGDTLASLAQRYLGSKDRYLEIFEANRDVLHSPDLLPIGVQLKIPPRELPAK